MSGPTTKSRERRDAAINLRVSRSQRALIDRAAEVLGKNRSDFLLDAACREADAVLMDRRFFVLSDEDYDRFCKALDRPPSENPKLRRLMTTKAPWER